MAEEQSTVEGQTPPAATPPAQPPAQQSTQQSAGNGPSNQDGPIQRLETAIAAMPEQIANALREAAPKQPQKQTPPPAKQQPSSAQQGSGSQSSGTPATQQAVPGKKKSFSEWWFGG